MFVTVLAGWGCQREQFRIVEAHTVSPKYMPLEMIFEVIIISMPTMPCSGAYKFSSTKFHRNKINYNLFYWSIFTTIHMIVRL